VTARSGLFHAWLALVVLGAGCVHPAWTNEIREQYGLSDDEVRHVQFFASGTIRLRREEPEQDRKVVQNALVIADRLRVDDVIVKRGTPGIAVRLEGDHILVSFSRAHPERALWFSRKKDGDGRFYLSHLALGATEQPFEERYSSGFTVSYAGRAYRTVDKDSWEVFLTYDDPQSFESGEHVEKPEGFRLK
jgi:hypothetical protein